MSVDSAARLASQYGPFFFAVLFALVMLPRAVKQFQEVSQRRDSPTVDHWIFGAYFLLTFAVLIGLVYFASSWWAGHQPIYVVSGAIHKLNAVEVWSPDPMFFKKEYDPSVPGKTATFDVNFLAYQEEKPFGNGTFEIRYRKPYDLLLALRTTSVSRFPAMVPTTTLTRGSTRRLERTSSFREGPPLHEQELKQPSGLSFQPPMPNRYLRCPIRSSSSRF